MGQFQPVQDPLGINRLVQQLNIQSKERAQEPIRNLQTQLLKGNVEQQQGQLTDQRNKRQETLGLKAEFDKFPNQNKEFTALNYLKKVNPERAKELEADVFKRGAEIGKISGPDAFAAYVNERTGQNLKVKKDKGDLWKMDTGDAILVYDWRKDKVVKSFPKAQKGGVTVTTNADGTTTTTVGGSGAGLPRKLKSDLASSIASNEQNISRLNRIADQYLPEFLTFKGGITSKISSLKSKAGADLSADEKKFLGNRRKFTQNINQLFNAYRKEITGAAASVQELESLKKATLSEDLSPAEFEASFDEFRGELLRSNRISRRIMREGIKNSFGKDFDDLFTTGQDDDTELRGQELAAEGLQATEIADKLIAEGYE